MVHAPYVVDVWPESVPHGGCKLNGRIEGKKEGAVGRNIGGDVVERRDGD